ncbi:unnamed protein product, partial [Gulo gulo]
SAPTAPLRSPLFASGPGSHGAGALLSRLYRAAGRGGGQRGALGRLCCDGAPGPISERFQMFWDIWLRSIQGKRASAISAIPCALL